LKDTDKNRDREITMVLGTQQSSEKFSKFVLQQQKLQQHVYTLGSYDSATHKFIFDNPKLDFSRFESPYYDYGRVYASDSFFDLVKQRHIVLSWVNETDMEELE
jgi:sucrose-6-phosphate hydrolase SacC (GH32 family)